MTGPIKAFLAPFMVVMFIVTGVATGAATGRVVGPDGTFVLCTGQGIVALVLDGELPDGDTGAELCPDCVLAHAAAMDVAPLILPDFTPGAASIDWPPATSAEIGAMRGTALARAPPVTV